MRVRFYFRPLLVPTLWLIPLLAILCALGTWQIQRLHWKLDLIARIHEGLIAPPIPLAQAIPIVDAAHIDAADYRRVLVRGSFQNSAEIFFFTTNKHGDPVYHVLTPFFVVDLWASRLCDHCARDMTKIGGIILVDRGWIPVTPASQAQLHASDLEGERTIAGIIRKPAPPNWFTPPVDRARRIVHTRDPDVIAQNFGFKNVFPMFLEADVTPNPGGWPKGGVTIIDLPNDHLQYAITWFGLAIGLLAVYLSYHASRGRLGWR
jgi:surfeit locus 1 family protein